MRRELLELSPLMRRILLLTCLACVSAMALLWVHNVYHLALYWMLLLFGVAHGLTARLILRRP